MYTRLLRLSSYEEVSQYAYRAAKTSTNPSDFVEIIERAIFRNQKIKISYKAESDQFSEVDRNITPLGWQLKNSKIYLTAINAFHEIRTYRLDRITKVKELFIKGFEDENYDNYYDYIKKDQTDSDQ